MSAYKSGSSTSGQPSGHLCRDHEDRAPAPQSQRLPRKPRLQTWPLKEHPQHPSLPRALPADPASLRRAESPPPTPHPIPYSPPSLSAQSGRRQAAGPLACGSGLSFGASFPGTGLSLSNLGALQGHSFAISASLALFWLKDSQDHQGPGTRWSHPYRNPWRVWPVWTQTQDKAKKVWGEGGWGEIRDLGTAWLKSTNPQWSPGMLCQGAKVTCDSRSHFSNGKLRFRR